MGLYTFQSDNDGFQQSIRAHCEQPPNPSGWCSLVMNMSAVATPNHDLWRVRNITYNSHVRPFKTHGSTRGINNGPNPRKGRCCGSSAAFCACDCNHCSGNNIRGSS